MSTVHSLVQVECNGAGSMDDEVRQFMQAINNKLDDILDCLSRDREDIDSTRGHVAYVMKDNLTLGKRITKLEDEMRRMRRNGNGA
jgi:mevalonate pyrophosphate decarboxylase